MLNNIVLMGRLTRDPELRHTAVGTPVANFSIAVDRRYAKDKERQTDFFDIVAWGPTGDFLARHFVKGQPVCVQGRLQQRNWTDKNTNTTRYAIEVIAENIHFAGFKKEADADEFDPYAESVDDAVLAA